MKISIRYFRNSLKNKEEILNERDISINARWTQSKFFFIILILFRKLEDVQRKVAKKELIIYSGFPIFEIKMNSGVKSRLKCFVLRFITIK